MKDLSTVRVPCRDNFINMSRKQLQGHILKIFYVYLIAPRMPPGRTLGNREAGQGKREKRGGKREERMRRKDEG